MGYRLVFLELDMEVSIIITSFLVIILWIRYSLIVSQMIFCNIMHDRILLWWVF